VTITNEESLPFVGERSGKLKIAVAMVSHESVPVTFAYDLASMYGYTAAMMDDNCELSIHLVSGTYVHAARQQMLENLKDDHTHILWLDTDMRFPSDALLQLLVRDVPVVGINYAKREIPTDYVAIKRIAKDENDRSVRLVTDDSKGGLEEVEAIGFGLTLMRTSSLVNLPSLDERPWFWFEWLPGRRQMGEDVYFCKLLRELGERIFVDHDLSKECAHTGQFEYRLEHVQVQKGD